MIIINDLLVDWEDRWKYVDDSSLLETLARDQESILQTTLDGINQWCVRNNMSLSPRQCKEIFICFLKNNPDFPPLTIDEQPIDWLVKSAKLLGVVFNDDLTRNDRVTYIVKKSLKRLYMLGILKRARADTKTLITMYVTYVRPILEYCAQVWHYNIPEYLSKDIERIQLKAMKIIDPSLSYNDALAVFDIPTYFILKAEQLCLTLFRKKVLPQSSPLSELIQTIKTHSYNLRVPDKLVPPRCRTSSFRNYFIPSSVIQYNEHLNWFLSLK